jgi:hypothetical protein
MMNVPNAAVLTGTFRPMRFEVTVEDCVTTFGEMPFLLRFTPHGHWMDLR